jgi:CheY-like chemotaxis protein
LSTNAKNPLHEDWDKNWSIGLGCSQALLSAMCGTITLNQQQEEAGKSFIVSVPISILELKHKESLMPYNKSINSFFNTQQSSRSAISKNDVAEMLTAYALHSMKNILAAIPENIDDQIPGSSIHLQNITQSILSISAHPIFKQINLHPKSAFQEKSKKSPGLNIMSKNNLNILILDDNNFVMKTLERFLKSKTIDTQMREIFNLPPDSITVYSFEHAEDALDFIRKNPLLIDIVITDLNMPGHYRGFDIVKILKKETPDIIVCLFSGNNLADTSSEEASQFD